MNENQARPLLLIGRYTSAGVLGGLVVGALEGMYRYRYPDLTFLLRPNVSYVILFLGALFYGLAAGFLGLVTGLFIALNEYDALTGYLRDGRFEIDNNLVENTIHPTAVGRKHWLFLGHPQAGWRSAVIYSMIGSCRRRGLNPHEYLTDVLRRPAGIKDEPVGAVAAGQLEATHPELQLSGDPTQRLPPIKAACPSTIMPGLRYPFPSCSLVGAHVCTATCTCSGQTAYVTPVCYAAMGEWTESNTFMIRWSSRSVFPMSKRVCWRTR